MLLLRYCHFYFQYKMLKNKKLQLLLGLILFLIPAHSIVWWSFNVNRFQNHADRVNAFLSLYPDYLQNSSLLTMINIIAAILLFIIGIITRSAADSNSLMNRVGIIEIILGIVISMWMTFTLMWETYSSSFGIVIEEQLLSWYVLTQRLRHVRII